MKALNPRFVRRAPAFWATQTLGWGTYGLAKYALSRESYPSLWRVLLLIGIGALLSLPLRSFYRYLRRRSVSLPATVGLAVLASFAAANLWLLLYDGILHWRGVLPFEGWSTYAKAVLNKAPVLLAWSALYLGIKHWQDLQAEQGRALEAMAHAREAQLQMLRYQLHPHFLFNALNSLRALIGEDADKARNMVTALSGFLRYSLLPTDAQDVALREELTSIRRYLEIEQIRFEDRLLVSFEVEPEAEGCRIPGFLLHPLVENAVKYGAQSGASPLRVRVAASASNGTLRVEIANSGTWVVGPGTTEVAGNGTGVGLRNVRQRLEQAFPGRHRFEIDEGDGWVRAVVELGVE